MRRNKDTWILAVLLILLGFLVVLTVMRSTAEKEVLELFPRRTSYSTRPNGVKALYLTLERLGYRVRRHAAPLYLLPQDPAVRAAFILSPEPFAPLASDEWRGLAEWVRDGRLACLAFDLPELGGVQDWHRIIPGLVPKTTPADLWKPESAELIPSTQAPAVWPSALTRDAPRLVVKGEYRLDLAARAIPSNEQEGGSGGERESGRTGERENNPPSEEEGKGEAGIPIGMRHPKELPEEVAPVWNGAATLYRDEHGPVVAYSAWGKGGFLLVSSPWLFSNDGLDEGDNLALVLNAVDAFAPPPKGGVILFDEFHHGYGQQRTLWQVTPIPVRIGLVQAALALLLLLFGLSRRFAAPIPLPGEERSRAEYLASMATLYQRARATPLVRQFLEENFRREVAADLALEPDASDEQLVRVASQRNPALGQRLQGLWEHLAQVKQRNPPPEEALLRLAAEMYSLKQEVRNTI